MKLDWFGLIEDSSGFIGLLKSKFLSNPNFFGQDKTKGQLISKCLFGIFNSPKKRTKKFDFTTIVPQVKLVSFVFCEN